MDCARSRSRLATTTTAATRTSAPSYTITPATSLDPRYSNGRGLSRHLGKELVRGAARGTVDAESGRRDCWYSRAAARASAGLPLDEIGSGGVNRTESG